MDVPVEVDPVLLGSPSRMKRAVRSQAQQRVLQHRVLTRFQENNYT